MIRDFFNFKRAKSPMEALVFYGVCVVVYLVLAVAADHFMGNGGL